MERHRNEGEENRKKTREREREREEKKRPRTVDWHFLAILTRGYGLATLRLV